MTQLTFDISQDPPARLDKALSRDVPEDTALSRSRLMKLISQGDVCVNQQVTTDLRAKVQEGDHITITLPEAVESHILPEDIPLDILYEDEDLLVVNKPVGMVVHPAPGTASGTLVNALLHHFGDNLSGVGGVKRPGIVHRIDKDTSGVLVVAKSDAAHHGLSEQFAEHSAQRRYLAVCYGVPASEDPRVCGLKGVEFERSEVLRVETYLSRHRTDRQRQAVFFEKGKHAVTRLRVIERFGAPNAAALIECWLETGRTHQIRVHTAYCGHSLIGDPVYGGRRKLSPKAVGENGAVAAYNFPRQALHAATLGFTHPITQEEMSFEAPLPEDLSELCAALTQPKTKRST